MDIIFILAWKTDSTLVQEKYLLTQQWLSNIVCIFINCERFAFVINPCLKSFWHIS